MEVPTATQKEISTDDDDDDADPDHKEGNDNNGDDDKYDDDDDDDDDDDKFTIDRFRNTICKGHDRPKLKLQFHTVFGLW